jgi:RNA polymerase sigma-70 factor, ECF subfamily
VNAAAARAAAERAARDHYGRLLAWLAWQWRDIAGAEDALGEAFARALARWPADGVPAAPQAWLLAVARRELLMAARRRRLAEDPALRALFPGDDAAAPEPATLPDERLRLMFVCAHPAIAPEVRSALMLQVVLGLDAVRIASAFLVKPEAMSKRLSRAKAKIKETGIRFEEPEARDLPERVAAVLEAIYGAYTLHWGDVDDAARGQLAEEALYLAELVAAQLPGQAEALGLAALLGLCEARRAASRDAAGAFVPLDEQDPARWNAALERRAEGALGRAAALASPGPYQLEACIQAAHMHGRRVGQAPWDAIVTLYAALLAVAPSIGAHIGHAVATARSRDDPWPGLALLGALDATHIAQHQPWWAARAHLLAAAGRHAEAVEAYGRALALTVQPAVRDWLAARADAQSRLSTP